MLFGAPTRFKRTAGVLALAFSLVGLAFASPSRKYPKGHASGTHKTAYHGKSRHKSYYHPRGRRATTRHHAMNLGQRVMDPQRATEIQQALIAAHYLNGSPTGLWDTGTQTAMQKYQADNGWQTKITPDSRAIIKLGLGPKQDEGEYSSTATAATASDTAPVDPIRTMATSEMPTTAQN